MVALSIVAVVLLLAHPARAQEITPDPSTYSFGSTSEFSPYAQLQSSATLAPTGQDTRTPIVLAALLIGFSTVSIGWFARRRLKSFGQRS